MIDDSPLAIDSRSPLLAQVPGATVVAGFDELAARVPATLAGVAAGLAT